VTKVTALVAIYAIIIPAPSRRAVLWALPGRFLNPEGVTMRVQLLAIVTALALTTTAASAYTRHHHKHHARVPNAAQSQADPRVTNSMNLLKAMTAKLGPPRLEGNEAVGGKEAPGLYFGKTKINNTFDIVDAVGVRDGKGMTATLFAKGGDEYIRVSTSVPKPDGSGRAVGTVLAGPALETIKGGKSYYGEVPILGTPYITGYEPIMDSSGVQIGVYYVGYKK
jgi:hypothetical protein